MVLYYKKTLNVLVIAMFIGASAGSALAYMNPDQVIKDSRNENELVCNIMGSLGLFCAGSTKTVVSTQTESNLAGSTGDASNTNLSATIYNGNIVKKFSNNEISLVRAVGSNNVYEITNGMKHLIPNAEIFNDYGYKVEMVRIIPLSELNKYPRIKLIQTKGDKKVYYLTETGLRRLISDVKIYESYGSQKSDIVIISKKEMNIYPENRYIYSESPLNRDVFMLNGAYRQYLTPMAIRRMGLMISQVAPVNQFEMGFYQVGEPIIN